MLYNNWLFTGSLNIDTVYCPPLKENVNCDVLVIGGGFTGLHAAHRLVDAGKKVILLDKHICGGSSSGQSGGFLTPESEEDLDLLIQRHGKKTAETIYQIPIKGVDLILSAIRKYKFNCDLRKQDSIYLSIKSKHNKLIEEEADARKDMGLPYEMLDKKGLRRVHPGKGYLVGLRCPGSYGINSFSYTQEMKNLLINKGVRIYEDSEVKHLKGNTAKTSLGSVTAKNICVCIDKMKDEFSKDISEHLYHLQIYMTSSEPLSKRVINSMFPDGELMCWDARWNYAYYRIVEGDRLVLGGSSQLTLYDKMLRYSPKVILGFINELKGRFPLLKDVSFPFYWGGLVDVTRDTTPIADYDSGNKSIQYALGCVGLPWAAFCGDYLARRILNPEKTEDLSRFLGLKRKYFMPLGVQKMVGKPLSFALSHLYHMLK
ncbi:MAG TPA: FAD-binding oxidoreductase [Candidatus Nanoarchaeia archaeon]|nr:FAD-binding oxidoreductase [Candidatus Nanoarchaeia archaeon]